MNNKNGTLPLRFAIAVILFIHGIGGMFNNGVSDFGNLYLNQIGFAPFGLFLAWAIKLSHVATTFSLLFEKYVLWTGAITIFILVVGIVLVHYPNGWFVVGGGRNGVEFNFLLIFALVSIMFPKGILLTGKK
jgi:putative oxidoreductase